MKITLMIFSILAFSNICLADLAGTWHGTLTLNGTSCEPTSIIVTEKNNQLSIQAGGDQYIHCSSNAFWLNETYGVEGSDLYKYDIKMGNITDSSILGKERVYDVNGYWRFWDFISFQKNGDGSLLVHLNFGDEYSLDGTLTQ